MKTLDQAIAPSIENFHTHTYNPHDPSENLLQLQPETKEADYAATMWWMRWCSESIPYRDENRI